MQKHSPNKWDWKEASHSAQPDRLRKESVTPNRSVELVRGHPAKEGILAEGCYLDAAGRHPLTVEGVPRRSMSELLRNQVRLGIYADRDG
mmetsp:Transcript_21573/g.32282  ORF Transcript_21573/g.32282 Transcript_21573/m.32282 type:complete len:90 (+) Transcript_21573:108-377(+)